MLRLSKLDNPLKRVDTIIVHAAVEKTQWNNVKRSSCAIRTIYQKLWRNRNNIIALIALANLRIWNFTDKHETLQHHYDLLTHSSSN